MIAMTAISGIAILVGTIVVSFVVCTVISTATAQRLRHLNRRRRNKTVK